MTDYTDVTSHLLDFIKSGKNKIDIDENYIIIRRSIVKALIDNAISPHELISSHEQIYSSAFKAAIWHHQLELDTGSMEKQKHDLQNILNNVHFMSEFFKKSNQHS